MTFGVKLPFVGSVFGLAFACSIAAATPDAKLKYFRADQGAVGATPGSLPDDLDAPSASVWHVPLDSGHSTPIFFGGKIFLTTYHVDTRELATVALDEETGKTLWRQPIPTQRIEQTHPIGSPATSTPACDSERVYVFFGSFGLVCYDLNGAKVWERPMAPFQDEYGAGSSPILVDDKLILLQDHDIDSFLGAFDRATGKPLWRIPRPDAVRSYSTPSVWMHNGVKELLVAGALELAAYNPVDGKRLWSANGLARIVIPAPAASGDIIYMASWAPGGDAGRRLALDPWPIALSKWDKNQDGKLSKSEIDNNEVLDRFFRIDLDQNGLLDQKEWERHAEFFRLAQNSVMAIKPPSDPKDAAEVLWKHQKGVPYVSTPVIDKGALWMVKDGGIVTKLDTATGNVLHEERVPGIGNYFASPIAADGKVYFANESGTVSVVAEKADWQVISSHAFHEKIYATPAVDRDRLFIRTEEGLYCFRAGKKADASAR